jgi:hypothetical protein
MIINNIDVYRDGGTIKVETNEGTFYIDRRIRTETKANVYDDYPKSGNIIDNGEEIKQRLYDSLESYEHPFYKNIEGIREFIKPKQR